MENIIKRIKACSLLLLLALCIAVPMNASAEKRQVEGNGMYLMGDSDTENVAVAKERAKQEALRNASEQAAVFVESMSVVDKGVLTSDEIRTYTASIMNIIGTPQISMTPDGNGILFRCHLVAVVDSDDFKNLTPESMRESKRLAEENARLTREMDELKQKYAQAASEAEKQEIRVQIEQAGNHYMTVQDAEAAERFFNEGCNFDRNKSYDKAVAAYQKAIHYNPQHSGAYNNLGIIYDDVLKDYVKAEEYYKLAIKSNPLYANAYNNLGTLYVEQKRDYVKAEEYYKKAIQINPQLADGYRSLGTLYREQKRDYVKAEEYYKKAIQVNPQYAGAYFSLGYLYTEQKRDYVKAEEYYKKAIQINPQYAYAYTNLAGLYLEQERYNDAMNALKKSIAIAPDEYNWDMLGVVYLNLGQYAKAVEACNNALWFDNNMGFCYYIRGQAYEKLGDKAKALSDMRRATELSPDNEKARQAYQRLMGR
ncbi:tetratricopeptide repeat protein [Selenomonas ruminantium]|uniref:Tfp pilus assembly protein PilF n=1 Tax=Selenomonas ruminantium TaxID=971 RepID=A0A1I0W1A6_SELRU|nr:tetratricopeptide repeat protein [Selenomonas ruminantium]SFA82324.1 Tfp pilus assembly protein PilF [Selenomonas ruminantium]